VRVDEGIAHAATILAASGRGSSSWTNGNALPAVRKMWFPNETLLAAAYRRLRHPITTNDVICPLCRVAQADKYGDHIACCLHGGRRTFAHTHVLEELAHLARAANTTPRTEAHPFGGVDANLRMDVILALPNAAQTTALIDVATTHFLATSHITANAFGPAAAATSYESVKRQHYATAMSRMPVGATETKLFPFVVDSLGGVSETAAGVVKTLAQAWAARTGTPISACVRQAFHRICSTVVRDFADVATLQMRAADPPE
jgi:hypothetical protein